MPGGLNTRPANRELELNGPLGTDTIGVLPREQPLKSGTCRYNIGVCIASTNNLHTDGQVAN
jgi:hypothetical protein